MHRWVSNPESASSITLGDRLVFHKLDAASGSVLVSRKLLLFVDFLVVGTSRRTRRHGIGLNLGLLLSAACLTACGPKHASSSSAMDQKVAAMIGKMGVPGVSSTPSKAAMALDCPPIKSTLDEVRNAPNPISSASRQALNAWASWCNLKPLQEQAS